jgi:3-methyladenine DNA glycosylase AlkC
MDPLLQRSKGGTDSSQTFTSGLGFVGRLGAVSQPPYLHFTAPAGEQLRLPSAPRSIEKGKTLATLLGKPAVQCLAGNLAAVAPGFDARAFEEDALAGLAPLSLTERGRHLADVLHRHLPRPYSAAVKVLLRSLTPPLTETTGLGLGVFFYLPHVTFVGDYGVLPLHNGGRDPFATSMWAQHELTRRFSAEFSIRAFLVQDEARTLRQLLRWTRDPDPHVRRLCSEGSRPRLPWARRIPSFMADPRPVITILEALKDDPELYVRRSVANHVGDIAKDHPRIAFELCERWLDGASAERRAMIRHALRHPAKKGVPAALRLRRRA